MGSRETALTRRVVERLRARGAYVVKHHGHPYARTGVPDLLVCYRGSFLGIEVKTDDGSLTRRQAHELELIGKAGGRAFVVQGDDQVAEILTWLDGRTYS